MCREFSEILRARPDCDRAVNMVAVAEESGERNHLPSRCYEFDFFTVVTLFEQWVDQYEPPKRPLWLVSGKWCIIHSVQLTVCDDETWSTGIQVQRIDEPASFAKELGRSTPVSPLTYLSLDQVKNHNTNSSLLLGKFPAPFSRPWFVKSEKQRTAHIV